MVVEGPTEEQFVYDILLNHLANHGVVCDARHLGGLGRSRKYQRLRADLESWMKEDFNPDSYFTTMIDLYAIPKDFPKLEAAQTQSSPREKVLFLEEALRKDLSHPRFVPYIQLHEFEALMLCDPSQLGAEFPGQEEAIKALMKECLPFANPELIDEGAESHPAMRIIRHVPAYKHRKLVVGTRTVARIGLASVRQKCQHFNEWLVRLESLNVQT
jgi:hypothetical protein